MDREALLAAAKENGRRLGVLESAMGPLHKVSDTVLRLMADTKSDSGFATILEYPKTNEGEARWVLE